MFKLIGAKRIPYDGEHDNLIAKEFLCDTDADFAILPVCDTGSMAVSIESGKVMVVNTAGSWVEFGASSGGSDDSIVGTWKFNAPLTSGCPISHPGAKINFTTDNNLTDYDGNEIANTFVGMYTPYATTLYFVAGEGLSDASAIGMGGFESGFDGVIHITGGEDINNEEFITWLKANAVKQGA